MPRLSLVPLCAVWLSLAACATGGRDVPAVDQPGQWRHITRDDATSRCLGTPATPLCAVETLLACFQRGDLSLCRRVDAQADQYAEVFASPADSGKELVYRVVAAEAGDQDGDIQVAVVQREVARGQPIAAEADPPPSLFLLRRLPDGSWTIVNWDQPE